jgi:hypothetical protein
LRLPAELPLEKTSRYNSKPPLLVEDSDEWLPPTVNARHLSAGCAGPSHDDPIGQIVDQPRLSA